MESVQIQGKGNRVSFSLKPKLPLSPLHAAASLSLSLGLGRLSLSLGIGPVIDRAGYGHPSYGL